MFPRRGQTLGKKQPWGTNAQSKAMNPRTIPLSLRPTLHKRVVSRPVVPRETNSRTGVVPEFGLEACSVGATFAENKYRRGFHEYPVLGDPTGRESPRSRLREAKAILRATGSG